MTQKALAVKMNCSQQYISKVTQKALAVKMNCSQQYISKVLKGRENLSLETLCKIEKALDVKILNGNIIVK